MGALSRCVAPILAAAVCGCGSVEYGRSDDAWRATDEGYGSDEAITLAVFYEELAPYGEWRDHAAHGQVFVPFDPEYRPYRNGHWVESDQGLSWVSYDAIGWAVCHYGQWTVLDDGRWAWIPGTEWAPAWVEWRRSERYVGWAPQLVGGAAPIVELWIFVEVAYLLADFVATVALEPALVGDAYARCAPIGRTPGWHGPGRRWLRARGVRGIGRGRPPRVVRPGPPRRRPPPGRHVRPADGRSIGGRIVGRGRPVRVRRPGERPEDGETRVRRPDGAGGLDTSDERERPRLRLHGPAEPRRPVTAARERPSVDPSRVEPRMDAPTPRRSPAASLDPRQAERRRDVPAPVPRPSTDRLRPRPVPRRVPPTPSPRASRPIPYARPPAPAVRPARPPTPSPAPRPSPPERVPSPRFVAPRPSAPPRTARPTPRPSPAPRVHRSPAPRIQRSTPHRSAPRIQRSTPRRSPSHARDRSPSSNSSRVRAPSRSPSPSLPRGARIRRPR